MQKRSTAAAAAEILALAIASPRRWQTPQRPSGDPARRRAVAGIKPVPTQILGTADWQGIEIAAQAMTAVPFVIYNGTSERIVKPGPHTSSHLMVMLDRGRDPLRFGQP